MARHLTLTFLLLLSLTAHAQQSAIKWIDNDLTQAFQQAKSSNKMVFAYAYTTWCGPCIQMKKSVFSDPQVGQLYNEAFVNVKLDMESGDGPDIGQKYQVQAYPTFLWLDSEGNVVHRSMGGRKTLEFMELAAAATDPDQQLSTMTAKYEAGDRSPVFLKQYAKVISESVFTGFEPIAQEYLDSQSDWTTPENMRFLFDYSEADISSSLFRYTLEHRAAFEKLLGKDKVEAKVAFAAERDRSKSGIARDDVEALKIHYLLYYPEYMAYDKAMETYLKQLMYSPDPVEQEKFKTEIQLYLASIPDLDWNFYNAAAWQLYEITDDPVLLQKTATWTQISITKESNAHNTDTMAHILYKLGDKQEAKRYADLSIQLAQQSGVDYSATLELLKKL